MVRSVYEPFLEELRKLFQTWWPNGALHPDLQWARVPNEKHFRRIKTMLDTSKGRIFLGGESNEKALKIGPTVVTDVGPDDSLMKEYVNLPLLSIGLLIPDQRDIWAYSSCYSRRHDSGCGAVSCRTVCHLVVVYAEFLNCRIRPKPLVLYAFTNSQETKDLRT